MKKLMFSTLVVTVCMFAFTGAVARADDSEGKSQREFRADLRGKTEVPQPSLWREGHSG